MAEQFFNRRIHQPRRQPSEPSQAQQIEPLPDQGARSPASGGLARDTAALPRKQARSSARAKTRSSSKATRSSQTNTQTSPAILRRSVRFQKQQQSTGAGHSIGIAPAGRREALIGASPEKSPSKRPRSTEENTQSGAKSQQTELAVQHPKPLGYPYYNSRPRSEFERQLKRARLTRENVDLVNAQGARANAPTPTTSASTDCLSTTKTDSTMPVNLGTLAQDNGILLPQQSKPPANLKEIQEQHARPRTSISPPASSFELYVDKVHGAGNEATLTGTITSHLLKDTWGDRGYNASFNRRFTALPKDVGFNKGLSPPQPDYVQGLEKAAFRPLQVDRQISGAVLYDGDPRSMVLPHVAGEMKGPDGNMNTATIQSAYSGAALVYARNQALSLVGNPDPAGHAEIRTFTTDGHRIDFFAHYAAPSEWDGTPEYHQYRYASTLLTGTYEGYKDGRKNLRNMQDHARDQSYALRDQIREYCKQRRGANQPITEHASLPAPSGTSRV